MITQSQIIVKLNKLANENPVKIVNGQNKARTYIEIGDMTIDYYQPYSEVRIMFRGSCIGTYTDADHIVRVARRRKEAQTIREFKN